MQRMLEKILLSVDISSLQLWRSPPGRLCAVLLDMEPSAQVHHSRSFDFYRTATAYCTSILSASRPCTQSLLQGQSRPRLDAMADSIFNLRPGRQCSCLNVKTSVLMVADACMWGAAMLLQEQASSTLAWPPCYRITTRKRCMCRVSWTCVLANAL